MDIHNQKILDYDSFDFKNSSLIKPPTQIYFDENASNKRRSTIVIDSRDRNTYIFPTPAKYEIDLDEDIQDVIAAELCFADVPLSAYLVNENNNKLHVNFNSAHFIVLVPQGDYTPVTLAASLRDAINNTVGSAAFKVEYDSQKDNFAFSCTSQFTFTFKSEAVAYDGTTFIEPYMKGTIGKLLGFSNKIYQAQANTDPIFNFKLVSEFRKDFNINNYVVLNIDSFTVNKSNNNTINKSFAVLSKKTAEHNSVILRTFQKTFNPPIPKLGKLKICFRDYYGNLYDFQNQDHRIEICVVSLKNCRKYQSFANS